MGLERIIKGRDIVQIPLEGFYSMSEWSQNNWDLVYKFNPIIEKGVIKVMQGKQCSALVVFDAFGELNLANLVLYRYYEKLKDYVFMHKFTIDFEDKGSVIRDSFPDCSSSFWVGIVESALEEAGLEMPKGYNLLYRKTFEAEVEKAEASAIALYLSTMAYILHYKDNQEVCEVERTRHSFNKAKNKKGKAKAKKAIVISSTTYRIKYVNTASVGGEKRDFTRHTEAWKVRGHWRHLQSGKTIWVREHVKGNKEAKIDHKIYDIQCNKHFYEGEDK